MASLLNLLVVATSLMAVAHGASVATSEAKENNCTMADGFQALSCLIRMNDFISKIEELDMEDKNEVKEFKRSCDSLQTCIGSLGKCKKGENDKESAEVAKMIQTYCDAVVYVAVDFAECGEKLESKDSKCFDEWDPFPDDDSKEKNEKKKEDVKKESCKNFFGKDNCLKKEITETCSEKEWLGFRDHFLSLNSMMKQCDFTN